jgi:hypothetical protein
MSDPDTSVADSRIADDDVGAAAFAHPGDATPERPTDLEMQERPDERRHEDSFSTNREGGHLGRAAGSWRTAVDGPGFGVGADERDANHPGPSHAASKHGTCQASGRNSAAVC